jgi:hypothetical protein
MSARHSAGPCPSGTTRSTGTSTADSVSLHLTRLLFTRWPESRCVEQSYGICMACGVHELGLTPEQHESTCRMPISGEDLQALIGLAWGTASSTPLPKLGDTTRRGRPAARLAGAVRKMRETPEGQRNSMLNTLAYYMARDLVLPGELSAYVLADELWQAATYSGLPISEVERTLRSAFHANGIEL